MRKVNLDNVQEAGSFTKLPAGVYEAKIIKVEDVSNKNYLKIYFDITSKGEYQGWFKKLYDSDTREEKQWQGNFIRSYKESALPFFKALITSVENSNKGFTFDGEDDQSLLKKSVGLAIGYEEYINSTGKKRERMSIEPHSIDKVRSGEIKVPELKKLDESKTVFTKNQDAFVDPFNDSDTNEVPFDVDDSEENPFA